MAKPAVHEMLTQMMFGDGPIAALMSDRVLAGRTHPRYLSGLLKNALLSRIVQKPTLISVLDT